MFSFGFESGDIESETEESGFTLPSTGSNELREPMLLPPKLHSLKDMLSTLPSHICFKTTPLTTKNGVTIDLLRRDLFDIRAQLMAEDNVGLEADPIAGLSTDDIVPNVYEGGFKTWECSVDLAAYVSSHVGFVDQEGVVADMSIIELGAGTASPSTTVIRQWLSDTTERGKQPSRMHVCLADYNRNVLELATVPNFFLASQVIHRPLSSNDIETDPGSLQRFQDQLSKVGVEASMISGSWTPEFVDLVPCMYPDSPKQMLILASESIYSPNSIHAFTQVLLGILEKAKDQGISTKCLVAAKRVYFGVGGGIDEFYRVLNQLGGIGTIVWKSKGTGVGRVIVEVTLA